MEHRPFQNEGERTTGQGPSVHAQRLNFNECLVLAIEGMEVRRIVIPRVHPDGNAKKARQFRYRGVA